MAFRWRAYSGPSFYALGKLSTCPKRNDCQTVSFFLDFILFYTQMQNFMNGGCILEQCISDCMSVHKTLVSL